MDIWWSPSWWYPGEPHWLWKKKTSVVHDDWMLVIARGTWCLVYVGYWKWPFIVEFPITKWWFSIVMLVYQRVPGWWFQFLWKIWVRQWEGWHPIYEMENKKMFQTTNQICWIHFFVSRSTKWIQMVLDFVFRFQEWFKLMFSLCWFSAVFFSQKCTIRRNWLLPNAVETRRDGWSTTKKHALPLGDNKNHQENIKNHGDTQICCCTVYSLFGKIYVGFGWALYSIHKLM